MPRAGEKPGEFRLARDTCVDKGKGQVSLYLLTSHGTTLRRVLAETPGLRTTTRKKGVAELGSSCGKLGESG